VSKSLQVRRGGYVDSVTLMQVSRRISAAPGVTAALVAMATDLNLDMAASMGFALPERASPNEMLVAVEADDEDALASALRLVETALRETATPAPIGFGVAPPPVTLGAGARRAEAAVALISTPGEYAFADAVDALDAGLHTMVFSDNVPVEQEVALKVYADQADVLVMGPDCGTAVLGGVGLGFANVVRPGPVGIVAASGTGAQQLMTLLDGADVGISHCLGVGGRDLSAQVGGRSTLRALDMLAADDATELVVVVSKPPDRAVAEELERRVGSLGKPVLLALLAQGRPDLTTIAKDVVETTGGSWKPPVTHPGAVRHGRPGGFLRGLFVGGTLCYEAMLLAAEEVGTVASNVPLPGCPALDARLRAEGHTMIDFGDDRLTRGRPHPMIDGSIRVERLRGEVDDPTAGVVLLDVVLGLGAADDPAGELVEGVSAATEAGLPVVAAVVGTRDDPQDLERQSDTLRGAGAWVTTSNAEATRTALGLLRDKEPA
jgi:FdrA protein